jgi:hypothetical protein
MSKSLDSVRAVSEQLAETFKRLIPLQPMRPTRSRKLSANQLSINSAKALASFYESARIERDRLGLGVIGRARVAFGVQQRLLVAGYPSQLVKQVLFAMLASAFVGKQ